MKYYAVRKGRKVGIYSSWSDCQKQVNGFSGAEFKSFSNSDDALNYLEGVDIEENNLLSSVDQAHIEAVKISRYDQFGKKSYSVHVYTDGGCRNTGNVRGGHVKRTDKAAWAYLIVDPKDQRFADHGGSFGSTNNVMEMTALLESLKKLKEMGLNEKDILVSADSQYVIQTALGNWKRNANLDLWKEIDRELKYFPNLNFEWVKGHATNEGNNFVDSYLNEYMDKM